MLLQTRRDFVAKGLRAVEGEDVVCAFLDTLLLMVDEMEKDYGMDSLSADRA